MKFHILLASAIIAGIFPAAAQDARYDIMAKQAAAPRHAAESDGSDDTEQSNVPQGEWTSIGKGLTRGGLFGAYSLDEQHTYEIDIEQSVDDPAWYRTMLVNENSAVAKLLGAPAGEYFCFNVADPEAVYFEEMGFYSGIYFFSQICAENGWDISDEHPAVYATLTDGVITWPAGSAVAYNNTDGNWYNTNDEGAFAIALPGSELDELWKYLGTGISYETTATIWYDIKPAEHEVDIYECTLPGKEGKYLVEKMFLEDFGSNAQLVVDTSDPDFGIIERQPTAITDETYGSPYIMSRSYYYINFMGYTRDSYLQSQYGQFNITRKGNRIDIPYGTDMPYGTLMLYLPASGTYVRPPRGKDAYIILPSTSGIGTAVSDAAQEDATEYYNLQGVRIANPAGGLYICRRGTQVSKEIIR